jgi:hypothetical protein
VHWVKYQPDFGEVQQRMIAWWNQEIIDRACVQVTAPLAQPREIGGPEEIRERWLDMEYVLRTAEERIGCTYWAGEAYPMLMPNLGPDAFAAYMGAELIFSPGTTWVKPIIHDWSNLPSLDFDFSAPWWQKMESMCIEALEYAQDKFFISLPDGHGGTDGLAAMRRPQMLCMDLIDYPEEVLAAMKKMDAANAVYYDRLFEIFARYQEGACGFVPAWGPGRTATSQCDFLALVSPAMSEKFIMPGIREETDGLDHSVFHLDGPDALVHLDMLLEMPGIEAIQWVPGAGNPTASGWLPYLKRIQEAGRSLWLSVSGPAEVEVLMQELDPHGLMMRVGVKTREMADQLVKSVAKWTRTRV